MKLSDIKPTNQTRLSPRIVLYGAHGVGKSSLGASAPSPIFIQTEDGLGGLEVDAFPLAKTADDLFSAVRSLASDEHGYKTVVVDSIDWAERLLHQAVAKAEGKSSVEKIPYGKGLVMAAEAMRSLLADLDRLRDRGMTIVVLGHERVSRYEDPRTESYDRATLNLNKHAAALVAEWCDILAYAHIPVRIRKEDQGYGRERKRAVDGSGERMIGVQPAAAYDAKNRYGLPPLLPLHWDSFEVYNRGNRAAAKPRENEG